MRVDDVGSHLVGDPAGRGRQRGDETRHEQRSARSTRGRHEPAAVREPLEPLGGIARPHDLDVAESLTQWQRRVVGSDDGDAHAVGDLRTREVEEERGDGVVRMARERRGHVEDPVRHRPVPYGPVMSRADGAATVSSQATRSVPSPATRSGPRRRVDSPVFGAFVPRWFELAVLCSVAFVAGYGLSSLVFAVIGAFHVVLVIAVSLNVGLLCALGVLRLPPRAVEARASLGAIAAVVVTVAVVGGMTVMNGWARSQHVLSTRDPGIYLITGKWLSERSQLPIDAAVGPFATSDAVNPASALGFFPEGYPDDPSRTGDLQPQFVHLYPALLGNADWLGGNRLAEAMPASSAASRCSRCSCSGVDGCRPGRRQARRSPSPCRCRRRSSAATRSQRCRCSCSSAAASRSRCGR